MSGYGIIGINLKNIGSINNLNNYFFNDDNQFYEYVKSVNLENIVLIQKCNSVEILFFYDTNINIIINKLMNISKALLSLEVDLTKLYIKQDKEAIIHFFETSIGLNSVLLGDSQVYGQLFNSYKLSLKYLKQNHIKLLYSIIRKMHVNSIVVNFLFGYTSIERICADFLENKNLLLSNKILINGAGNMARLFIKAILEYNSKTNICVCNRTIRNLKELLLINKNIKFVNYVWKTPTIADSFDLFINCAKGKSVDHIFNNKYIIDLASPSYIKQKNIAKNTIFLNLDFFVDKSNDIIKHRLKLLKNIKQIINKYYALFLLDYEKLKLNDSIINNNISIINNIKTTNYFELISFRSLVFKETRSFFYNRGFLEIQTPKITFMETDPVKKSDEKFIVDWYGKKVFLAQSNQMYKQMLMFNPYLKGVFEIGPFYRKEKYNIRHLSESYALDVETKDIIDHRDLMTLLEKYLISLMINVKQNDILLKYNSNLEIPGKIFRLTYDKAIEILNENNVQIDYGLDLGPERENQLYKILYDLGCTENLFFIENYPRSVKKFYTADWVNSNYTRTFDLIYDGWEICSGAERETDYDKIISRMSNYDIDPKKYNSYLDFFKSSPIKHGGFGLGLDRLIAKLLNKSTLKEAVLFPRHKDFLLP